ncbi:hypothetical protein PYW08_012390 [Mythimna loreyi]|uniref:Uncharacterized protein n=1 Tax=Mythimna loreyi TaxID=667449 RepID=A0ACC2Q048_9NEOP|nr:hypothetical protein PYW08_012390 [Mythimna loreyi]
MKRSRAPNFSNREIMHLLLLVKKYPIIANKKTDGASVKEKAEAWKNLAVEYNSSASDVFRTAENLMACYKNQKIKVKKQHSNHKMLIKAPHIVNQHRSFQQNEDVHELILDAVQINLNWDLVSQSTNIPSHECKIIFNNLAKNAKKEEMNYQKEVNRTECSTGGGPPPQSPNDAVHEKVKTLIGPSLEGLHTTYCGDYELMKQQQELLPEDKKINLLEQAPSPEQKIQDTCNDPLSMLSPTCSNENIRANKNINPKRLNLLKSKLDPSLRPSLENKTKKTESSSFVELAEDKKELVKSKKQLADNQLILQQQLYEINNINIEIANENLEFTRKKNEMELKFLKEKYELELAKIKMTKN